MKILKYKKTTKGRYILELEDNSKLTLYEETILFYNLLITNKIDNIDEIINYNLKYEVYYTALNSIKSRFKTINDTKIFLLNKDYSEELVDNVINILINQGYLNDRIFSKSFINNQIITTNRGPYKIKRDLINKGVSEDICNDELIIFDDNLQLERIDKCINKLLKSNHNKGGYVLKSKIFNDIKNLGYDIDLINSIIDNYNYDYNNELYDKEYNKLYNKLSKKYKDNELEYKIKEKLRLKGLYKE